MLLMCLGTAARCLPLVDASLSDYAFLAAAHACAILNGVAGVVIMSAPPAISAAWFAPHERTTATGIGQMANNVGASVSFLMGVEVREGNHSIVSIKHVYSI